MVSSRWRQVSSSTAALRLSLLATRLSQLPTMTATKAKLPVIRPATIVALGSTQQTYSPQPTLVHPNRVTLTHQPVAPDLGP